MQGISFCRKSNQQRKSDYREMAKSGIKGQKELQRILQSRTSGLVKVSYSSDIFVLPYLEINGEQYSLMGVLPVETAPTRIVHKAIYQRAKNPNLREQFYDSIEQRFDRAC
jgi:hypothetical protein